MTRLFKTLAINMLAVVSLLAPIESFAGDTLQRIIDFGTLTVGTSASQAPMTMISREGELMGFDIDLASALASAMQVQLDVQVMPFGELLPALEAGRIDMILSNMSITPERTELVSFLGPYMMSGKSILTKNSTLSAASSTDAFNRDGLRLIALGNSTSAVFIEQAAPTATLIEVPSYDAGVKMLIEGGGDAMVADLPFCLLTILRYPEAGLTTLEKPLTIEPVGIAISKNDQQFHNLVDNYLRAYERTGVLARMRKKWFEDSSWVSSLP